MPNKNVDSSKGTVIDKNRHFAYNKMTDTTVYKMYIYSSQR